MGLAWRRLVARGMPSADASDDVLVRWFEVRLFN